MIRPEDSARPPVRKWSQPAPSERYVLRLYITGLTPRSVAAIENVRRVCEEHLKGQYQLEIIDIYQQPSLAKGEQIIAAPTLVKKLPAPLRRIIGDMTSEERLLLGLDLRPVEQETSTKKLPHRK